MTIAKYFTSPMKAEGEVISYVGDFTEELGGDSIVSAVCSVDVYSGVDANPGGMLVGSPEISGPLVSQRLQLGIPGVIYQLIIQATTLGGNVLERWTKVAIEPSGAGFIFNSLLWDSCLYPIDISESFTSSLTLQDGRLFSNVSYEEGFSSAIAMDASYLVFQVFDHVNFMDGFIPAIQMGNGVLQQVGIFYQDSFDGFTASIAMGNGTLDAQTIITYAIPAEGFTSNITMNNGSMAT